MKWYIAVLKKYAVFHGRARRGEYWMFFLVNLIIAFVIGFATGCATALLGLGTVLNLPVAMTYGLVVLLPGLAVAIRRMHDIGRSGWWILFPFLNFIFLVLDSQPGRNEYGPSPKVA